MSRSVPSASSKMGIVKEKIPFCTHGLSESGYSTGEDASLYPRLVLIRVQRKKRYLAVPTVLVSEGTVLE